MNTVPGQPILLSDEVTKELAAVDLHITGPKFTAPGAAEGSPLLLLLRFSLSPGIRMHHSRSRAWNRERRSLMSESSLSEITYGFNGNNSSALDRASSVGPSCANSTGMDGRELATSACGIDVWASELTMLTIVECRGKSCTR